MSRYIHIEGTDLSGKTSAVDGFLARRAESWDRRHNSLSVAESPLNTVADTMAESGDYSSLALNLAYAACIVSDLDTFSPPERNTVQESTSILRSIGHVRMSGAKDIEAILCGNLQRHPSFDYSIYLTASLEERRRRALGRKSLSTHDKMIFSNPELFLSIDEIARSLSVEWFGSQVIDTTNLSLDEVVSIIEAEVL